MLPVASPSEMHLPLSQGAGLPGCSDNFMEPGNITVQGVLSMKPSSIKSCVGLGLDLLLLDIKTHDA